MSNLPLLSGLEEHSTSTDLVLPVQRADGTGRLQKATLPTSAELGALNGITASTAELNALDVSAATLGVARSAGVSFTEDGSGTSYTGAIAIPANTLVWDIQFRSSVLWDGTAAALDIGDDDDANGYFAAINLKATDLLVGEVLSITNSENWGGKQGVYLVALTGLKSATYYATANNIIGVVTPGAADGSAGRSFMHVLYSNPVLVASTNV